MENEVPIAAHPSSLKKAINATLIRRKNMWIIFGIFVGIIVITAIVVSISIVTTSRKAKSTTEGSTMVPTTTANTVTMTTTTRTTERIIATVTTTTRTTKRIIATVTTTAPYTRVNNSTTSIKSSCSVNAWIFLNEDQPANTNYNSSNSLYQRLIQKDIYQSVDILFICFVGTTMVSNGTVPTGNDTSYTIKINPALHLGGLTNQDYMNKVISDARKNNPNIKIAVTLNWNNGKMISDIFTKSRYSLQEAATRFAANLMTYLQKYDLDGFDMSWDAPISRQTSKEQFILLIDAIGAEFKQQTNKHYYLTLSPGELGNMDAEAVNNNMDFLNLQLYMHVTNPAVLEEAGVNSNLFAYGAKFEDAYQTAAQAYQDNRDYYHYKTFTCWRLNSDNYIFEQTQQQSLHKLCNGFLV